MKKLIALLVISAFVLTGCGTNQPQPVQQPQQVEQDEDEMGWFADEVLDMDDWGEKKKSKAKPEIKPKPKVDTKMPSTKQKASASKKNM